MPAARRSPVLAFGPAILLTAGLAVVSGCNSQRAAATEDAAAQNDLPPTAADPVVANPPTVVPAVAAPPLTPGAKTKVLEKAGDRPFDKTFDDLRFDIQPGQPFHRPMLPPAIEVLAGQRIRIRGYILPTAQKRGIKQFVLVRDNQECCFGPGAALYDCILVEMAAGSTAEFSIRPIAVEGTFGIQEVKGLDDKHLAVYHIDAESAQ